MWPVRAFLGLTALSGTSFRPPGEGTRHAFLVQLDVVEASLLDGDTTSAVRKLQQLRRHVDGCGLVPDNTDWVVDCADQTEVRALVDLLIANIAT